MALFCRVVFYNEIKQVHFFLSDQNLLVNIFGPMTIFWFCFMDSYLRITEYFTRKDTVFEINIKYQEISPPLLKATC